MYDRETRADAYTLQCPRQTRKIRIPNRKNCTDYRRYLLHYYCNNSKNSYSLLKDRMYRKKQLKIIKLNKYDVKIEDGHNI